MDLSVVGTKVFQSAYMSLYHDIARETYWFDLHGDGRPVCTQALMNEFLSYARMIETGELRCKFVVVTSSAKLGFGVGGDFDFFVEALTTKNFEALKLYAHSAVEAVYRLNNGMLSPTPVTTFALTRGQTLGGGFELALASDFLVAEDSSIFGFPEIRFNLFPGMGGMHFVHQRTQSVKLAEKLMISGQTMDVLTAESNGLVDYVVGDTKGIKYINSLIDCWLHAYNGVGLIVDAKREVAGIPKESLLRVTDKWAEGLTRLTDANVKHIQRLSVAQKRSMR